jgi:hypothetical protein
MPLFADLGFAAAARRQASTTPAPAAAPAGISARPGRGIFIPRRRIAG